MRRLFGSRVYHHMTRLGILLLAAALILAVTNCAPIQQHTLNVRSTLGGSVAVPGEGDYFYGTGEVVELVAEAERGYRFVDWTGDVDTIVDVEAASTTITMNGDYSITANFVAQYVLTIGSTEGGEVTAPGDGTFTYDAGTVVSLVATPNRGFQFINWTGDVGTVADAEAASTTVTMSGDYAITANFAKEVRNWYDLDAIRENLRGSYVLMNDLGCNTPGYTELAGPTANEGKGWEPIGGPIVADPNTLAAVSVDPFAGSLDGQGYGIEDLFIDRRGDIGVGLFGCVGERGVIEDVAVVNGAFTGSRYVGGLVAANWGTVSNSYSTGTVTGDWFVGGLVGRNEGAVSNSYSTGTVTGDWFVGGLVGGNEGTVSNSYSTGSVTGGGQNVGGLVGGNEGTVSDSYSAGSVTGGGQAGGLVGSNWRTVSNSYSTGSVTGEWNVGGLAGWNHVGHLSNSYSTGSVTGRSGVGGLVGENHDGIVSNSHYSYDEVLINGRNVITIGALFNEDFERWLANDKFLDVDERLSQEDGYYLINDISDFKSLLAFGQDGALRFRMRNSLDLADHPNIYIPYLAGEFDGNGHRISNLSFNFDFISQVGLFGYLASGGAVTRVSVENANITGDGAVGGLVGENDGTVSNSYCTGSVTGHWSVGGLVGGIGWSGGTVINSHYNYDELLINDRNVITIGALFNEDFEKWIANDRFLDVNERLSQEDGYYVINSISDFKQLLAFGQDDSLKFRLESDLDLGNAPNLYIPYLAGEFDGNGHKIRNLGFYFDIAVHVGLFGYVGSGGTISAVGVENVNVAGTGHRQVGGLAGGSAGTVSNSYSTGSVSGLGEIGGLVGWNRGTVSNSYSTVSVTSGGQNVGSFVGGLVGWNYLGTVSNSYSSGGVTGSIDVNSGGLVGANNAAVKNSFWDVESSGMIWSAGGTGKTTEQMMAIATFTAIATEGLDEPWDMIAVGLGETDSAYTWNIVDGHTYPFLSWQPVA